MGDYTCICVPGFTGKHCEQEIKSHPLCINNPCLNGGSCQVNQEGTKPECVCSPGFVGNKCETNINECQSNPCYNRGLCIDGFNNFTCDCTHTGYMGRLCDTDVNECLSNPCLNQGICFNTYGSYLCQCLPGFGGPNCQFVSI